MTIYDEVHCKHSYSVTQYSYEELKRTTSVFQMDNYRYLYIYTSLCLLPVNFSIRPCILSSNLTKTENKMFLAAIKMHFDMK